MRIAFISHGAELYGAELCLFELLESLMGVGEVDVEVVCPEPGPLVDKVAALGVGTAVVPYARWATKPASPRSKLDLSWRNVTGAVALYRHFRATRPELVVTNTMTVPSGALAAGRGVGRLA